MIVSQQSTYINLGYTKAVMRIIEPQHLEAARHKRKSHQKKPAKMILLLVTVGVSMASFVYFQNSAILTDKPKGSEHAAEPQQLKDNQPKVKTLRTFTGGEFKELYSSYAYPNTQNLQIRPFITGNTEADKRIQDIAESRGYRLSSVPVASIVKTNEPGLTDDDLIQPNALIAWQEMKAAALKDGIELQMTSAYRSIEVQRALFLRRMRSEGIYTESVAAGYVDDMVEDVLSRAAPPGYSRHHTGYTIDLACDGIGLEAFTTTSCYSWLSKNNYENAKKFGWVPSYPEGASLQGPEPEPWEYIWVSTYSLYE